MKWMTVGEKKKAIQPRMKEEKKMQEENEKRSTVSVAEPVAVAADRKIPQPGATLGVSQ